MSVAVIPFSFPKNHQCSRRVLLLLYGAMALLATEETTAWRSWLKKLEYL
jgi:hypothetical protein